MKTLAAALVWSVSGAVLLAILYQGSVLMAVMHRLDPWLVEAGATGVVLLAALSGSAALIVSRLLDRLLWPPSPSTTQEQD